MLEQLFGSKTRLKLLNLFFQYPTRSFYVREMAREIGSQLNAVRREIAILERVSLIREKNDKNKDDFSLQAEPVDIVAKAKYYQLCPNCLFQLELKSLLMKGQILHERELIEKIKDRAGKIRLMLLSGVFTGCTDAETDILLVGNIRPKNVAKIIGEFEKKLNKVVRYTIMSEREYYDRKDMGDVFLYSIFESKNIEAINELK